MGIGELFQQFFGKIWSGVSGILISGIGFLTILFTMLAFFVPINIWLEIMTILVGIASFFYHQSYLKIYHLFKNNSWFFGTIIVITLFFGTYYPFILDHFGYYVPTIKWISEIGLVKGVANLDLLLGQMSIWHIFQAGFSHFVDPFLRINSVLLVVFLMYIFEKKSWILLLFVPVFFLFVQSPSPDLPCMVISLLILNETLKNNQNSALLFALSMLVFSIKPTMIWVPMFSFLYSVFLLKRNLRFVGLGMVILLLFLLKNCWVFGFPIFPVQMFDFGFSWKPSPELLKISSEVAIQKTYDMQYTQAEIEQFSGWDYIKNWLFLDGIKSKIHFFFLFSLLAFLVFSIKKKSKIIWLLIISVVLKSVLVLAFSAQYRFFLDVFFVIALVLFYEKQNEKVAKIFFGFCTMVVFVFLSFPVLLQKAIPSFKLGNYMLGFQKEQLITPSFFAKNKYKTYQIGNLKFQVVQGNPFSFDAPIPAISPEFLKEDADAGIFPQQIDENLSHGFIWRKLSHDEREQLQLIISKF